MKITIAQLNPTIGDIDGNLQKALDALDRGIRDGSDLVVFPELFLTGYPPRDLLERPRFVQRVQQALDRLAQASRDCAPTGVLMGAPVPTGRDAGRGLYNAAVLIAEGAVRAMQYKSLLPTYDVFDEARYFDMAPHVAPVAFKDQRLGITVCEDAWNDPQLWKRRNYAMDPVEHLSQQGASIIINLSASPFHVGKEQLRCRVIQSHARKYSLPAVFVNQVGGNDELIFDGRSMCFDPGGNLVTMLPAFQEAVCTVDMDAEAPSIGFVPPAPVQSVHEALILGLRDYFRKCGFSRAVLGLSGGIDSAVVCCLASEALGAGNVLAVGMPGPYSSQGSVEDSRVLTANLGVPFTVVPIGDVFSACMDALRGPFAGAAPDITEENIQARVRGMLLMAFSNKLGHLLLSTGNKSEVAVGYCTLYGDMCGGLAVLSDVPKTMVYELARHINRDREVIPVAIIEKPPSAELRPEQKDQDSLPPYDVLDEILNLYVDEGCCLQDMLERGLDPDTVAWVVKTIDRNEYKRRQAPPGLKVTTKAFGMGRRMVIAARYNE